MNNLNKERPARGRKKTGKIDLVFEMAKLCKACFDVPIFQPFTKENSKKYQHFTGVVRYVYEI